MSAVAVIIGIDLGTTNSLCAVFEQGRPMLIRNAHGQRMTPSVVGFLPDGQTLVGAAARELQLTHPQRCVACFKRWMGTDHVVKLNNQTFNAIELSSLVLRSIKQDAHVYAAQDVSDAVITVPAYFNDHQRQATRLAGEMAGLNVRRIINEPTAAALTYGFHDPQSEKHILVIDLGGGTFDVTLMEVFEGTLEIISTAGESHLGGEDFTNRLVAAALRQSGLQFETCELKEPLRVARLRQECERAKCDLLEHDHSSFRIPNAQGEFGKQPTSARITRQQFSKLVSSLIERLNRPIAKVLSDGDCAPEAIDEVILVGGATRMPALQDHLASYLQTTPRMEFNPDEVVALGAAVQAALIESNKAVDDLVMTDVCPHTLGVEVVKQFGRQQLDGYFQPIIHRNTTIPVSHEETFGTVHANQRQVILRVFQGEHRKVKDNLVLGELTVDVPPGPEGTMFNVRFTYDLNGILEVEAYVPESQQKFRTVMTQHVKGLSQKEVRAAVRKMQKLKFYPRDDLKNQQLLLFCERIVGDVNPMHRQQLEEAIDAFEVAMSSGDREQFEHSRTGLLMMLSHLGYGYTEEDDGATEESH